MSKGGIRCPTCGAPGMCRVLRPITTRRGRRSIIVKGVEVDECDKCGERLYDLIALRRLAEKSPRSRRQPAA